MATTIDDMATSLRDFIGADVRAQASRRVYTAITDAILDMATYHRWSYYYQHGRINTRPNHTNGLVYYDLGTKTLTFTNAIPGYAADCSITINDVIYPIETRASSLTATLVSPFFLQQTILLPDAVPFEMFQDQYVLPDDFTQIDAPSFEVNGCRLSYVHPTEFMFQRRYRLGGGVPEVYTIFGDGGTAGDNPGKMTMALCPHPVDVNTVDFFYRRTPRNIRIARYSEGTITTDTVSTTVTGSNTSWTQAMVGSVIRISSDALSEPTEPNGSNPYEFEFFIKAVNGPTSITISGTPTVARSAVKYLISDPIDIDDKIMLRALRRNVERQMAFESNMDTKQSIDAQYKEALYQAIEADNRSFQSHSVGSISGGYNRYAYGGVLT